MRPFQSLFFLLFLHLCIGTVKTQYYLTQELEEPGEGPDYDCQSPVKLVEARIIQTGKCLWNSNVSLAILVTFNGENDELSISYFTDELCNDDHPTITTEVIASGGCVLDYFSDTVVKASHLTRLPIGVVEMYFDGSQSLCDDEKLATMYWYSLEAMDSMCLVQVVAEKTFGRKMVCKEGVGDRVTFQDYDETCEESLGSAVTALGYKECYGMETTSFKAFCNYLACPSHNASIQFSSCTQLSCDDECPNDCDLPVSGADNPVCCPDNYFGRCTASDSNCHGVVANSICNDVLNNGSEMMMSGLGILLMIVLFLV